MKRRRLVALAYSPWSEKARWALDHHRLPYEEIAFVPVLGTPWLKLVSGRLFGRTSVPTLLDDDGKAYIDSLVIARHADGIGQGTRLFPDGADEAIAGYVELSESMLSACREICMPRMSADPDAAYEATPASIPFRRAMATTSVKLAGYLIGRKYQVGDDLEHSTSVMWKGLRTLRERLAGRSTLLPQFSFADIAMAAALQWVAPLPQATRPIGEHLARVLAQPELAAEFRDLVDWRDRLYATSR